MLRMRRRPKSVRICWIMCLSGSVMRQTALNPSECAAGVWLRWQTDYQAAIGANLISCRESC